MYTLSNRLKIVSLALIVVGAILWGTGYYTSHHVTQDDVKIMLAEEASHGGHGDGHAVADTHATESVAHGDAHASNDHAEVGHAEVDHGDAHAEHVMHQIHNRP